MSLEMQFTKRIGVYLLFPAVLLLLVVAFWGIRRQLQDESVPLVNDFKGQRVMFIFPHPDDEITCAGTLKIMDEQGVTTSLITLTQGEAGDANGTVEDTGPEKRKAALGRIRKQEVLAAGRLLGVDNQEVLDFPDGGLQDIPAETLKESIRQRIARYKPTILISYDEAVGLYGHLDHRLTAQYVKEVFLEDRGKPDFPARAMYQVTMPKPMIRVALKISKYFQDNYPKDPSKGLPAPTMAVRITEAGKFKHDAMLLHQSQRPTFNDMQPYFDKLPPAVYYRIFDREYFAEVK
jgi:LmbE family N-acetylglucosaminyl deacetylase